MSLPTRDRVGLYSVPTMIAAVYVQYLVHEQDSLDLYLVIVLSMVASVAPFLMTFPASWRGEISDKRVSRLPRVATAALLTGALLGAYLTDYRGFEPRTGVLLATIAILNFVVARLGNAARSGTRPSRWSYIGFIAGLNVGFLTVGIDQDPALVLSTAVLYGVYGFFSHWMIRSVIDGGNEAKIGLVKDL